MNLSIVFHLTFSYPTFPELKDELFITETSQSVPQVVSSPASVYGKRTLKERHESVKVCDKRYSRCIEKQNTLMCRFDFVASFLSRA